MSTTHLGLSQQTNWTTALVQDWAKAINDSSSATNDFALIDAGVYASRVHTGTFDISTTWTGSSSPYTQTITLSLPTGVTLSANSKVDIQPTAALISQMVTDKCNGLFITNDGASTPTLTLTAVGKALTASFTGVQATVTEIHVPTTEETE